MFICSANHFSSPARYQIPSANTWALIFRHPPCAVMPEDNKRNCLGRSERQAFPYAKTFCWFADDVTYKRSWPNKR